MCLSSPKKRAEKERCISSLFYPILSIHPELEKMLAFHYYLFSAGYVNVMRKWPACPFLQKAKEKNCKNGWKTPNISCVQKKFGSHMQTDLYFHAFPSIGFLWLFSISLEVLMRLCISARYIYIYWLHLNQNESDWQTHVVYYAQMCT